MHPIAFLELHRIWRDSLKNVAFLTGTLLLVYHSTSILGVVICMSFMLHIITNAIGVETMYEEYTKGRLRFLMTMPISRFHIWSVKIIVGLLQNLLYFVLWSLTILIASKDPKIQGFLQGIDVGIPFLIISFLCYFLYIFAVSSFSLNMCFSRQSVWMLSNILGYAPAGIVGAAFLYYGVLPRRQDGWIIFLIIAAIMFLGGYILFMNRNPYHERRWLCRSIGFVFILAVLSTFVFGLRISSGLGGKDQQNFSKDVVTFEPSPDGEHVLILCEVSHFVDRLFLLDKNGNLVMTFDKDIRPFWITWPCGSPSKYLLLEGVRSVLPWEISSPPLICVNIETGEKRKITNLSRSGINSYYTGVSREDNELLGKKKGADLVKQNVVTDTVKEIRLTDTPRKLIQTQGNLALVGEGSQTDFYVETYPGSGYGINYEKYLIYDYENKYIKREFTLPPDARDWELNLKTEVLIATRRYINGDYAEYQVVRRDLSTSEESVLLDSYDLPRLNLSDFVEGKNGSIDLDLSDEYGWCLCKINAYYGYPQIFLISTSGNTCEKVWEETEETTSPRRELFSVDNRSFCIFYESKVRDNEGNIKNEPMVKWYILDDDEVRLGGVYRCDESSYSYEFFGNDKLLYEKSEKGLWPWSRYSRHLWIMDLNDGSTRKFIDPSKQNDVPN